jgi:hypothetical protein
MLMWKDNIKEDHSEIEWDIVDCNHVGQDRGQ